MPNTGKVTSIVVRVSTAAELLDCSRAHVYALIERGQLTRIQLPDSKSVRIPLTDVYALVGLEPPKTGDVA